MKKIFPYLIMLTALFSCDHRSDLSDAYGNFEVQDVIVASEATGKLLSLQLEEGSTVNTNKLLGVIDTIPVVLQMNQLDAQVAAVQSKIAGVKAQIAAQIQQKQNLKVNVDRVNKLFDSGVATQQQKEDLDGQLKLIEKQIDASKTQITSIQKEAAVLLENKNVLMYQLSKCKIYSPVKGVILEKYVKAGEMAVAGKPLFKVADLSSLELRCYITGDKLQQIKLDSNVKVLIDNGKEAKSELDGRISWISSVAEFTPKVIQTKEERVKLVYAVKVMVKNDGRLKIGMPGEMVITNVVMPQ
ncbi:MAG: HlyD family secretion protein [Prolixibacteraceae bacterium]